LQPLGVHGPSQVVDLSFEWTDQAFAGLPLNEYVIYELHVGTFTAAGTLDAVIPHLDRLARLGVTAIELMPLAQFPGRRNWGYDGVHPFAVQDSYGGPEALARLVDACHARKLSVILDVVYNHLGPEGNRLSEFGPYFTDVYQTPWGQAVNVDGPYSDDVRQYFIGNALQWVDAFHLDGLRLDAVHAIVDRRATTFLEELGGEVHRIGRERGRPAYVIAESDTGDPRLVAQVQAGGLGLDGVWCDDFHHSVHALLTGERQGYYEDYGALEHLEGAWLRGVSRPGEYSQHRRARHGRSDATFEGGQATVCVQNHDQVGNRMLGERLGSLVSFEAQKLAAGLLLLSPHVPLIFMGEEYGDPAPFQYFIEHGDPALIAAVRSGRRREFESFGWEGEVPDPQSERVFEACKLTQELCVKGDHALLHNMYTELLTLRARYRPGARRDVMTRLDSDELLAARRDDRLLMVFHFGHQARTVSLACAAGPWRCELDSAAAKWIGTQRVGTERVGTERVGTERCEGRPAAEPDTRPDPPTPRAGRVLKSDGALSLLVQPCSFVCYSSSV
jgi:maltooligosyltrehalose trehalohydrolase